MSYSEISRITGHSRNSVKAWLKKPKGSEPKYRRQVQGTKIAAYADVLSKALETDAHRLNRERRSALKLYAEIQSMGFTGDYSRVTEFIRKNGWRPCLHPTPANDSMFFRLQTAHAPKRFDPDAYPNNYNATVANPKETIMNEEIIQAQRAVLAMAAQYIGAAYESKRAANLDESRMEKEVYECIGSMRQWVLLTSQTLELANLDEFLQELIGNMNWDIVYCPGVTYVYTELLRDINRHFDRELVLDRVAGERDHAVTFATEYLREHCAKHFTQVAKKERVAGLRTVHRLVQEKGIAEAKEFAAIAPIVSLA